MVPTTNTSNLREGFTPVAGEVRNVFLKRVEFDLDMKSFIHSFIQQILNTNELPGSDNKMIRNAETVFH